MSPKNDSTPASNASDISALRAQLKAQRAARRESLDKLKATVKKGREALYLEEGDAEDPEE